MVRYNWQQYVSRIVPSIIIINVTGHEENRGLNHFYLTLLKLSIKNKYTVNVINLEVPTLLH